MKTFYKIVRVCGLGFFYLAAWFATSTNAADIERPDAETIVEQSKYWPPYVTMRETVEQDERVYKAGLKGVLIRVEDESEALIDFGRKGILRVAIKQTDLLEGARAIHSGVVEKEYPNWTMMVGRSFFEFRDGELHPVSLDSLLTYDSFLYIYLGEPEVMKNFATYARELDARVGALKEANCFPVIVHTKPTGGNGRIRKLLEKVDLEIAFMRAHLTQAYTLTMQHAPESFPHGVLTDAEGKTLVSQETEESGAGFLNRVLKELRGAGTH